jgi:hypothetical protein
MKITRKVFCNKANGQFSFTLPKETVMLLKNKNNSPPKKISFEILTNKEINELKKL